MSEQVKDIEYSKAKKAFNLPPKVFFVKMAVVAILIQIFYVSFAARFEIGHDPQENGRCLPFSVYLVDRHSRNFAPGDYIIFRSDERMVPYRTYGSQVAKQVKAIAGDVVEVRNGRVFINGYNSGILEEYVLKKLDKPAEAFNRTITVSPGEIWAEGTLPKTFDSRYWGTVQEQQIIGKAYPLF